MINLVYTAKKHPEKYEVFEREKLTTFSSDGFHPCVCMVDNFAKRDVKNPLRCAHPTLAMCSGLGSMYGKKKPTTVSGVAVLGRS